MKKVFKYTIAALALCAAVSSCWKESLPEADLERHEVTAFNAAGGDEEVSLSWSLPEGWKADEFIITYTDPNSEKQTLKVSASECAASGNAYSYSMKNLANDFAYTFLVQAVYGGKISGQVTAKATPRTTRIAVKDLVLEAGNSRIDMNWTKPADNVLNYTVTYSYEGSEEKSITVEGDKTAQELSGLENDFNYTVTIVANYANGKSLPVSQKAMPSAATVFFLSTDAAAVNQPITFTFNTKDIPTATEIKWTFPDGTVLDGAEVSQGIGSTGLKNVILSAKVNGVQKSWTIEVTIREYVIDFQDMDDNGDGFKSNVPVFSPDGKTVYSLTYNTNATLFAWDIATGTLKWKYATGQKAYNTATVNPVNGDIYFGTTTAGNFNCLDSEGNLKWKFTEVTSMQSAAPTTNADGTVVYVVDKDGHAYAINAADGTKIWHAALGKQGGGILVNGSEVLFGLNTGGIATLVWLNAADGSQIASATQDAGMTEMSGFAVSADKKFAYYSNKAGGISKVDIAAHTIVVDRFIISGADNYEPVTCPNGDVFVGSKDSYGYCLDADLTTVKWKLEVPGFTYPANNAFNYSHPCSDTDGNIYISSGQIQNWNFIVDQNGNVKEQWQYGSGVNDRHMSGNNLLNGVFYSCLYNTGNIGSQFVGKYVGGERYDAHGTDICGNCIVK